ncbi:DUF2567 domain-containing protein [Dactylosporangium sp. NBC_01737]|uniref:DUF2567 domain-containing protein n=1 Tax=Dactylosporangium sp. NBC_01737 TaxID=2975959 RepID=UPI002E1355DD|nr:DUF2567 domain-containing protein [Dactylosporangium sp. NBC_01737]
MSIAPIEPIDQPELPKPSLPRRRSPGLEALFGLVVAVVVTVLGAPVGLLWSWIAPEVELIQTPYGPYPIEGEPEGYFADDGWFMIIGAVVGILIAVVAWIVLRRYRGPLILAGLVVGSAAGAALAAWLGNKIGYAHYLDLVEHAPVDTHIFRPAKVRAGDSGLLYGFVPWVQGSLLIQAILAAVVYTGLAGFHASPTLTYDSDPALPGDPYHPAYAGYPYGAPNQPPAYGQPGYAPPPGDGDPGPGPWQPGTGQHGSGPWHGGGQPGPGPWPGVGQLGSGPWPEGGPAAYGPSGGDQAPTGPPVNGQPASGLLDLRKQDHASTQGAPDAPGGSAASTPAGAAPAAGPAHPQPGSADPAHLPPDPAREDWQAP